LKDGPAGPSPEATALAIVRQAQSIASTLIKRAGGNRLWKLGGGWRETVSGWWCISQLLKYGRLLKRGNRLAILVLPQI
jgi:hypothetical protein